MLFFAYFGASVDKLSLPILRRIAEPDLWPPFHIYIYPESKFPKKFLQPVQNPRFKLENDLPSLIKQSRVYTPDIDKADMFLIPCPLSDMSQNIFSEFLDHLKKLDYHYEEYNGANFIFLHSRFPELTTPAINQNNFLALPCHIITSGYDMNGEIYKVWVFAKNALLPLQPRTKFITPKTEKKMQIVIDDSDEGCLSEKALIRHNISKNLGNKKGFVVAKTKAEAENLIEKSAFAIVTACESHMADQFYDAINSNTIPIVLNNVMRFPFESELIDYRKFAFQYDENDPLQIENILEKYQKKVKKMREAMAEAREMFEPKPGDGGYIWALTWSLYMKYLAWLPIRRTKIIDNIFYEPNVFQAL